DLLGGGDLLRVKLVEQRARHRPGLPFGVPGNHVQPDAEPQLPARLGGQPSHPGQLLRHLGRRLAPGQVRVRVAGGDRPGGRRRAAEVDAGYRIRRRHHGGLLDLVVPAVEVERLPGPGAPHDGQELAGPGVPLVVRQVVAEPALLLGLAPGHHVEQQPAARDPLVAGGHLGGQGGRDQPGPEGDQELQPAGRRDQRGRGQPGVLAPGTGRGEYRREAELLRGPGHLPQVLEVRRPVGGLRLGYRQAVPAAVDRPAVARGGQEPVEGQRHNPTLAVSLNEVTAYWLKSTCTGISPALVNASETCCSEVMTAGVIGTASEESSLAAFTITVSGSPLALAHTAAQADWWLVAQACACATSAR